MEQSTTHTNCQFTSLQIQAFMPALCLLRSVARLWVGILGGRASSYKRSAAQVGLRARSWLRLPTSDIARCTVFEFSQCGIFQPPQPDASDMGAAALAKTTGWRNRHRQRFRRPTPYTDIFASCRKMAAFALAQRWNTGLRQRLVEVLAIVVGVRTSSAVFLKLAQRRCGAAVSRATTSATP